MSSSRALVVPNAFMQSLSVTVLSEVPPRPPAPLTAPLGPLMSNIFFHLPPNDFILNLLIYFKKLRFLLNK